MATWPKDTQASRNAFYGYPGKGEIAAQIVRPAACAMYYKGQRVKSIMFHRTAHSGAGAARFAERDLGLWPA
ncbi:hypothetical protein IVB02_22215 [Bradyrhizobium sp. 166]|uniref:hypothetical protein n=1 Tax=Bradyrhizobium sp. 166 TaxID=2782638 RepID=UPI001FF8D48C|nr:hypothetical protein [Bradyrhizobium sp. 166]MCK1604068.1 hypothetical protein [Bradyrhizobium sp. 166]